MIADKAAQRRERPASASGTTRRTLCVVVAVSAVPLGGVVLLIAIRKVDESVFKLIRRAVYLQAEEAGLDTTTTFASATEDVAGREC